MLYAANFGHLDLVVQSLSSLSSFSPRSTCLKIISHLSYHLFFLATYLANIPTRFSRKGIKGYRKQTIRIRMYGPDGLFFL